MFRVREPRPTASTPEQNCEAEKPFNQEIWAEVPGKPYAGLVSYFRNNFSEKIRLRLTMTTLGNPLCIGRKKWAGRRSGTVKFMSNRFDVQGERPRRRQPHPPDASTRPSADPTASGTKSSRGLKCRRGFLPQVCDSDPGD